MYPLGEVTRTVTVTSTLPRGLSSARGSSTANAPMTSQGVQIGMFNVFVDCSGAGASIRSGCYYTFNSTPNGNPVDADLRAGDEIEQQLRAYGGGVFGWGVSGRQRVIAETADYRITLVAPNATSAAKPDLYQRIEILRDMTTFQVPRTRLLVSVDAGIWGGSACWTVDDVWTPHNLGVAEHRGLSQSIAPTNLPGTLCEQY